MVHFVGVVKKKSGIEMSFQMIIKIKINTVILMGVNRGKITIKNTRNRDAPSSTATSSNDRGMLLMKPVYRKQLNEILRVQKIRMAFV